MIPRRLGVLAAALLAGWCASRAPAADAPAAIPLPTGGALTGVDFERHVMGLFGRAGCSAGSCHGSFQGKGGFRLSLFGYDPERDFFAITRDAFGRRLDPAHPDQSLLLLKATGQGDHGGLRRFSPDSWSAQVLRAWIAAGAPWTKGSGDVQAVTVDPPELAFTAPGQTRQLKVRAAFADGSQEDITAFCEFRTNDDATADVSNLGLVKGVSPGDTAVVVSYRGTVLPVRVLVPRPAPSGFTYPRVPEVNYVDREVFAKLRRLNIVPSELSSDAEFLRRVTIDTIGTLPTPDEVRAFLADSSPDKRAKKIDELLAHPLHAALWATKLSDVTGNNTDALENPPQLRNKRSQMWHDWLRHRLHANVPYDQVVKGILCATSRDGRPVEEWLQETRAIDQAAEKGFDTSYPERPSLDLFWRRQQQVPATEWAEKTAAAFLGVRLECAQCHKHPFDRWTQADYRAYANVFTTVAFAVSPEARKQVEAENAARMKEAKDPKNKNQVPQVREVFVTAAPAGGARAALPHPDTGKPLPPRAPGGPEIRTGPGEDPREQVFEWLRSPDNLFFAPSFVNRVWGHYFGIGLVDPVDDFKLSNPPSNPRLLAALAKDFIDHKYDIRHIERTILLSRTYQLTSDANETNRLDRNNYSHAYVRPMMAEVVVDILNAALGVTEDFGKDVARPGAHAIEVGSTRVQNNNLAYVFRIFGRPQRSSACDCERAMEPALPQRLFFMADPAVQTKLAAAKGRLQALLDSQKTEDEVLEELFLATLSRPPSESDRQVFAEHKKATRDRLRLYGDTLWALINTREFILNH